MKQVVCIACGKLICYSFEGVTDCICNDCVFKAGKWFGENINESFANPLALELTSGRQGSEKDYDVWVSNREGGWFRASLEKESDDGTQRAKKFRTEGN